MISSGAAETACGSHQSITGKAGRADKRTSSTSGTGAQAGGALAINSESRGSTLVAEGGVGTLDAIGWARVADSRDGVDDGVTEALNAPSVDELEVAGDTGLASSDA